jgi:hypothetical protein
MVAIPTAPKKEGGAPIITVPQAKVKLHDPEFSLEPVEVERKDGTTFFRDPGLNAQVEIIDDMDDGSYDGVKFYQNFKLKWNEELKCWELRDGTSLGAVVNAFVKTRTGKNFDFEAGEPFEFDMTEWDGFEFQTKIVPKKHMKTHEDIGSMCHHETIMAIPKPKRKKEEVEKPEPELSPEEEAQMKDSLGDD